MPRVTARALMNQRVLGYLSWQRRRYRVHRREVLDALVEDMRAEAPDHVAITGDLVNISLPAEFVQAAAWLRQLGTPDEVTVIPGNHDAYVEVKWREAWAHWSDYMCGDGADSGRTESDTFPFLRRRGSVALIGMSTAVATPPTFATGRLGRRQLRRARGAARRSGGREPLPRPSPAPSAGRDHDRLSPAPGRRRRARGGPGASAGRAGAVRPPAHLPAGRDADERVLDPGGGRTLGLAARRRPAP